MEAKPGDLITAKPGDMNFLVPYALRLVPFSPLTGYADTFPPFLP